MRFSDFLLVSDPADLDFIVGYSGEQNIRIDVSDFFADNISGSGNPGYIPVFTSNQVIGNSQIFQDGSNIVIGGVNGMGYRLAVGGSLYALGGSTIESVIPGSDTFRTVGEEGDSFIIPNDEDESIWTSRRIIHAPAVLTTESATLGQLNTAISSLEGDIELLLDLKVDKTSVGAPNGVASLDATGKIPLSEIPDSIIGQVEYMGTWNALTNTPTLNPLVPEEKGHYYVVSVAGTFGGVDYQVGDWIISNGVYWDKIDNTDAVTSVFGRIGAILALEADYQSFYPRLSQAYDNPTWINTLAFSKITDVPPFLLENQTITLSGDVTGSGKTSILSTISNNAVTDSKLRDSVGTSVIGRASSTTGDPADIQAITDGHVLQRSGGTLLFGLISSDSIASIDWSKIINTPTTLSGYGITDAYTKVESDNKFVPYTGASANVNLGSNNITANAFVKVGGTSAQFLKADGSVDVSQYVPTTRSVNAGTGLTGGGNLSSDITVAFDTTWGDIRYAYRTREIIAGTGLLGGGDLSANRTLSFDTIWGDARYVPYTGATANVDLGEKGIRAGYIQLDTTPTSTPTSQGTIYWDQNDNTIDAVLNGYIMKIGEDQFYPVKNQTGASIAKGTSVRFAGTLGASGRLLIQPFIADGSVPSTYFMGVTAEDIADGADGKVLWFGRIRGINTTAYNEGDILYASTTVPGGFQTTVPEAPNNIVQIAAVITVHANNGTIFIRPTLGSNINKDEGVKITSPVVGQLLQLQSGNIWENKSLGQVIGGLSSQFLKGDGSLDSTSYVPFGRQITINGTTYDLSSDRVWNVGTVTSVGLSVPVGFAVSNSPITSTGNIALAFDTGYSLPTDAKQLEWDTAYANRIASLTTNGTSGAATFISNVLNIPQYQAQGNYITNLTGEVTAGGPGSVVATISNSAVTGKVLTGLSVTGSSILASDTILEAFGKLQGQVNGLVGGLMYEGTWDASTNTPTITSGVGVDGTFYIVSVAGNTTIDGLTDWQVGDWIVFHDTSWQKVDNTESVTSVNGQVGAVSLSTGQIPEGTNLYFTDERSRQSISLTTTGSSGAATYSDVTGVFNIPQYSLSGLGGVPTSRVLTINGVNYDLSADRSWTVGDVRTDSSYANPSWITSLAWGKITGTPTTLAGYGITDAYTQAQVDSLLSGYVTLATDQTITGLKTIVRSGDVLNFKIGTDTLYGLKVAYNQNELVPSGEATWSFVNTFNRNGVGYEVTPISFFRGVLVTGERLLTSSINTNLLDYYGNNPSGRYPVYTYNTGVQQFSTGILVGYTTGLVNAVTGAISQLPSGVVANFNGRVIGQSAANSNEFVTLSQLGDYVPTSRTLTINGVTYDLSANRSWTITSGVSSVTATSPLFSSGGATPNITIQQSGASASGFLSSTDWNTFNNKANANGSNASGTWGINITGSAGSAGSVDFNNLTNKSGGTGTYQTSGDFRAPIFYDSNNTAQYIDPSAASNIRNLYVGDTGSSWSDPGGWGTQLHVSNGPHSIIRVYARNEGIETGVFSHIGGQSKAGSLSNHNFSIVRNFSDRMTFYSSYTYANGYLEAQNDMRAPIFYDSNDTSYYVDPNSVSVQSRLTNVGLLGVNSSNARNHFVQFNSGTASPSGGWIAGAFGDASANRVVIGQWGSTTQAIIGSHTGSLNDWAALGYVATEHIFYAPSWNTGEILKVNTNGIYASILYDSNNTAYYVNPAGTSYVSGEFAVQQSSISGIRLISNSGVQSLWVRAGYDTDGSATPISSPTNIQFQSSGNSGGTFTFVTGNTRALTIISDYAQGSGSLRAPIFYDSNNTGYYLDPASTNYIFKLIATNGITNGSSSHVIGANLGSSPISWNNSQLELVCTDGGNVGLSFHRAGYTATSLYHTGGSTLYTGGILESGVDFRAPIFYDSNNTGYYVNPNGTSRLATVIPDYVSRLSSDTSSVDINGITFRGYGNGQLWLIGNTSYSSLVIGASWDWDREIEITYTPNTIGAVAGVLSIGQFQKNSATWTHGITDLYTNNTIRYRINASGLHGFNTTDFSYTASDNSAVVAGGISNNQVFINGSIQLLNNSDAIVFGRGTSSFIKDEEIGFGWGGGWFMTDSTFLRVRNGSSVQLYTPGIMRADGDMRSPIFYDQNNTGYYLDPASTSNLYYIQMPHLGNGTANIRVNQGASENWRAIWIDGGVGNFGIGVSSAGRSVFGRASMSMHMGASESFRVHSDGWDTVFEVTGSAGNGWFKGDVRSPIYYDSNDTSYFVDPNSTSTLNTVNAWGEISSRRNDTQSLLRSYNTSASGPLQFYLDHNFGNINIGNNRGVVFAGGTYWEIANSVRSPIFYDSNNTGFYVDATSTTWLNEVYSYSYRGNGNVGGTGNASWHPSGIYCGSTMWQYGDMYKNNTPIYDVQNIYNSGWYRNYGRLGVYNQTYGGHFYQSDSSYWSITGGGTSTFGIQFRSNYDTGIVGYVYGETGGSFGLLSGGSWAVRTFSGGGELYGTWTTNGDHRAPLFYDSNDTSFYINPNSLSRVFQIDATSWLRAVNGSVIATGIGGSMTMTASTTTFGAYLRTSGHMVFDQTNTGFNVYVLDGNSVGVVKNAGSQSWSAFSDRTIKTVHSIMDNNLSKLDSITPIYYSFNNFADDKNRIGLIAQEVQEQFPELVEVEPRTQKLTLDYTGLIPVLLGAIKELKTEIETLKTKQ